MGEMIEGDSSFADAWSSHHRFLLDVAYRLLGSYSDAEDIVQEAFTRLLRADVDPIEDVRAWLVVVVSRLCLDQLRSARVKREAYIGPWFPEPLALDPAQQQRVIDAFIAACAGGELKALLPLLDPSVMGWADVGGTLPGVDRPNVGRDLVAQRVMEFFGAASGNRLAARVINGEP